MDKKTLLLVVLFFAISNVLMAQWNLIWSDEFDYSGLPDTEKWIFEHGPNWYNGELQYYTNERTENCRVENGNLIIEAIHEDYEDKNYTSARLNSVVGWKYGRYEIRAKLTQGNKLWPAIWMFPESEIYGTWPKSGEIDIMEYWSWDPNAIYGTIHTEAYNHPNGTEKQGRVEIADLSNEYHVFTVEWYEDQIRWFVDDNIFYTIYNEGTTQTYPFDHPFHFILNIAVESGAPGEEDSWIKPTMEIDYVRVYEGPLQGPEKEYAQMPGKVEAENFVNAQGVKVENCNEGGKNVGYIEPNDFMEYDVNVLESNEYTIAFRVASVAAGNDFDVYLNDNLICNVEVTNTNGWQSWKTVEVNASLEKGKQLLRIVSNGNFNLNWFEVNDKTVDMNRINNKTDFLLVPNPSKGTAIIKISEGMIYRKVIVVNQIGETILDSYVMQKDEFKLEKLNKGLYVVILYDHFQNLQAKKLIVE
ncbi:MAG: family 16 glycosylhydrolase [Salinivirgaceae bacterium]|jgi:beta-glucanase (GH16 family)|nr:family 16 glycosylhydrolase [Salinivirgaceae bacterium]